MTLSQLKVNTKIFVQTLVLYKNCECCLFQWSSTMCKTMVSEMASHFSTSTHNPAGSASAIRILALCLCILLLLLTFIIIIMIIIIIPIVIVIFLLLPLHISPSQLSLLLREAVKNY